MERSKTLQGEKQLWSDAERADMKRYQQDWIRYQQEWRIGIEVDSKYEQMMSAQHPRMSTLRS